MYDERFFRMWEFYLAGGIVMFESGAGCNYQIQYIRDRNALPITRDYMAEAEARLPQRRPNRRPGSCPPGLRGDRRTASSLARRRSAAHPLAHLPAAPRGVTWPSRLASAVSKWR